MEIDPAFYDAELRLPNEHLRAAADVQPADRVLDIGCGTGLTTREAARAAVDGRVLGVDVSAPMLEWARRLTDEEGLDNITYEEADAQTHPFEREHFDVCISRCGTMFFADPVAAFTNIGRALRPGARLALLVWQGYERNEWATSILEALTVGDATPASTTTDLDPFSLADPAVTEAVLTAAGFSEVRFTDVDEPVFYGPDATTAYETVVRFRGTEDVLTALDAMAADVARQRLRATLVAHETDEGVRFDARMWVVTANIR